MAADFAVFKLLLLSCALSTVMAEFDLFKTVKGDAKQTAFGPWLRIDYKRCPLAEISIDNTGMYIHAINCATISGGQIDRRNKEKYQLKMVRTWWCPTEQCKDEDKRYHEGTYHRIGGTGNTIEMQFVFKMSRKNAMREVSGTADSTIVVVYFLQVCKRCVKQEALEPIIRAMSAHLPSELDMSEDGAVSTRKKIYTSLWGVFTSKFKSDAGTVLGPEIVPLLSILGVPRSDKNYEIQMPFYYITDDFVYETEKQLAEWYVFPRSIPISEEQARTFFVRSSAVSDFKHMGKETKPSRPNAKESVTLYTGKNKETSMFKNLLTTGSIYG